MAERDSKNIARQWDREIEDEMRRVAEARTDRGPWRSVVWTLLWVAWLALLGLAFMHLTSR